MMVKLYNALALKREMVVHEEGEIMPTEQDLMMELSMVSMELTLLHCPLCLRPLNCGFSTSCAELLVNCGGFQ